MWLPRHEIAEKAKKTRTAGTCYNKHFVKLKASVK